MFNTTYIHQSRAGDQYINITEKKAPTDDSVRLLSEFEAAAKNKILESIRITDSSFECVIHSQFDMVNDLNIYCAIFSLNGKKMTAKFNCGRLGNSPEKIGIGLRDAVAKEIANEIAGAFRGIPKIGVAT